MAFETRAALMRRSLLHRFEELRAVLRVGRAHAGVDRGVDARTALQSVAAQAAVIGEHPGLARRDGPQGFGLQAAVAVERAGDLFDVRHAAEVLGRTHAHVEPRFGEHAAEFLGLVRITRRQKDFHEGNVSVRGK